MLLLLLVVVHLLLLLQVRRRRRRPAVAAISAAAPAASATRRVRVRRGALRPRLLLLLLLVLQGHALRLSLLLLPPLPLLLLLLLPADKGAPGFIPAGPQVAWHVPKLRRPLHHGVVLPRLQARGGEAGAQVARVGGQHVARRGPGARVGRPPAHLARERRHRAAHQRLAVGGGAGHCCFGLPSFPPGCCCWWWCCCSGGGLWG
jgi:hypothetical protein